MTPCVYCPSAAVAVVSARSRDAYRAAATCTGHKAQTRAWAARAGPVHEQPLNQQHEQESATLF